MSYNGRLIALSHGGGCSCKMASGVLNDILKSSPIRNLPKELLTGSDFCRKMGLCRLKKLAALLLGRGF